MLFGLDLPSVVGSVGLWTLLGLLAGRVAKRDSAGKAAESARTARIALVVGALAVASAILANIVVWGDFGWFVVPGDKPLLGLLTGVPAILVAATTLPRLMRVATMRPAGETRKVSLTGPPCVAALAAVTALHYLVVPHVPPRPFELIVPLAALGIASAVVLLAAERNKRALPRILVVVTMLAGLVIPLGTTLSGADPNTADASSVHSGYVLTEGNRLYYEVAGEGPPLLMIAGGGGDAAYYGKVRAALAENYQVITYGRRGSSRSVQREPGTFTVAQQARDAVAVLEAQGHSSGLVFGSSAGAIVALELIQRNPGRVRGAVVHEPPTVRVLPDRDRWLSHFADVYQRSFELGAGVAMLEFTLGVGVPPRAYLSAPPEFSARSGDNQRHFIRQEMLPFVNYVPSSAAIKAGGVPFVLAAGGESLDQDRYYARTVPVLAERLGVEPTVFPGHHLSYFDNPGEWAAALRSALDGLAR
ncbi:alpha/beta fold hydrolase [Prauserella marina]|nr:alpha/beta hydrolase [Prauserella marina]